MKNWYLVPLAAVVGLIAGSWGPREDLKRFKESVRESEATRTVAGATGFDAFAKLTHIPDVAKRPPKVERPRSAAPTETNDTTEVAAPIPERGEGAPARQWSREDLSLRLEEAAELWNTRVELAKAQWKEKLGATDEATSAAVDAAIATMNEQLQDTMTALADEIEKAEKMTPELGLRLMGDLSRTLAETYDAIGATLPEERRAEVSEVPVFEFIDPMVAEPLVRVQDKLDGDFMNPAGTRRGRR